ncbi:hypothetical protein BCV72DRAFT_248245 [Rhizopus microsporus var. microsporus]|uniref:SH3 domain-containing protein n=1 Tax=Rhizopus microsporus var. microsporus TaxID=86635 RepID=A0A1X0RBP7_RHIZD|nr:hypothetical protein BCV72DRAFT_248245 [Rhizopus microsporus var. microsporus]
MIFGSDPESYIGQYGPSHYGNSVGIQHHRQQQPQQQQAYEMTGEKTILSDPPVQTATTPTTAPATTTTTQEPNTALSASNQVTEMSQPSPIEYREKVKALHAYQANPDDPNELSFAKGEVLEIVDRNGNWWQARKTDGTVGIIPSNYVS